MANGMKEKILALVGGVFAVMTPSIAFAAPQTFSDLVAQLISFIDALVPIVVGLTILVYMNNTATGIYKLGQGKADPEWKQGMFWGIIIIAVMVSIWGILHGLSQFFFG